MYVEPAKEHDVDLAYADHDKTTRASIHVALTRPSQKEFTPIAVASHCMGYAVG